MLVRVGLTGGIGSGKSTVAKLLVQCGAAVIDADAISRELTAAGGVAIPFIVATFGQDYISPTGALDRDKMRTLVYADTTARKGLESIIHPLVSQETVKRCDAASMTGLNCIVFDVPLLVESLTWRSQVDHVLVVDCTAEVQIKRVMMRSQLRLEEIERIIASQAARAQRVGAADSVIFNANLTLDQLAEEVGQISARFGLSSD